MPLRERQIIALLRLPHRPFPRHTESKGKEEVESGFSFVGFSPRFLLRPPRFLASSPSAGPFSNFRVSSLPLDSLSFSDARCDGHRGQGIFCAVVIFFGSIMPGFLLTAFLLTFSALLLLTLCGTTKTVVVLLTKGSNSFLRLGHYWTSGILGFFVIIFPTKGSNSFPRLGHYCPPIIVIELLFGRDIIDMLYWDIIGLLLSSSRPRDRISFLGRDIIGLLIFLIIILLLAFWLSFSRLKDQTPFLGWDIIRLLYSWFSRYYPPVIVIELLFSARTVLICPIGTLLDFWGILGLYPIDQRIMLLSPIGIDTTSAISVVHISSCAHITLALPTMICPLERPKINHLLFLLGGFAMELNVAQFWSSGIGSHEEDAPHSLRQTISLSELVHLVQRKMHYAVTNLACDKKLPLIYLAGNSGARIGAAEEIKSCFKDGWSDEAYQPPIEPLLNELCLGIQADRLANKASDEDKYDIASDEDKYDIVREGVVT
ncbi:hypothetical protein ZIOFF_009929 [Zingiber officinale]|uniref:Uncharacterized protein n=1 Tax=Zingiber officinale TaxID=94328 RepID=A0A8J5I4E0_ZINOF|nr:hypothetical protein ZIOFF_009929 [Zingiber officinale]